VAITALNPTEASVNGASSRPHPFFACEKITK
jgi:hypothetical protein